MQYAAVVSDQFEWIDEWIVHKPTGARFKWAYPKSQSNDILANWGSAGDVLPNGDDYEKDEIARMAQVLLEKQRNNP